MISIATMLVCAASLTQAVMQTKKEGKLGVPEERLDQLAVTRELVAAVNAKAKTWVADVDQGPYFDGVTLRQAQRLMGVKARSKHEAKLAKVKLNMTPKAKPTPAEIAAMPAQFDSRQHWPQC